MTNSENMSIEAEANDLLIGRFVSAVGHDYQQDFSPHIYPNFSPDTVRLWTELESRLNGPTVLDFDRERCLRLIRQEIEKQDGILRCGTDYATSYHVGIKSGLNIAWSIIESCVKKKEE